MSIDSTERNQIADTSASSKLVLPELSLVVGGKRVDAKSGARISVEDPSNESVFASVPAGGYEDIDTAVASARSAFESKGWSAMRPVERSRLLEEIARKLEDHIDELALLESFDTGKPVHHAKAVDVPVAIEVFRYMSGWCTKLHGLTNPVSGGDRQFHSYTIRQPIGVVGAITPWNYPLTLASWKVASALAAGCTVVLKPSEITPLTALRLAELALEAGLPEGVLNVVTGYGEQAGRALVEHQGVDKITFTGSTKVGKSIVSSASRDLKRVALELGGKSPSLVFADADLEKASFGAANAIFFNAGQVCQAASRLYIEESVFDQVLEGVVETARSFKVGSGRSPDTMIGPLVSKMQRDRVMGYIEEGTRSGSEIATGGKRVGDKGYFVEPTVLVNTGHDSVVMREEIFGPVVVATPFRDIEDVVKQANDTRYGLAANIWTQNLSRAHLLADRLQAGTVWINTHGVVDVSTPFGGLKESGWGRELSYEGLLSYTETKTVTALLD